MNGPGEKTFKQLWRELCKEGWKPRKPTGMAKDHRYAKPGVKGCLDEVRRGVDFFEALISARGPIGKQDSYAAAGQQPPRDRALPPPAPSSSSLATVPAANEDSSTERIALRSQTTPSVPDATVVSIEEEDSAAEPSAAALVATEQDDATDAIPDDPELDPRESMADVEEAKSETDEPNAIEDFIDLDVFDGDNFMEGLRKERLFSRTSRDDVNLVATADISDSDSDADDEDIMADNEVTPDLEEGVEDVEDVEMNDDVPDTTTFDLTDDDLRAIAESGWNAYDEEHIRGFQVDAATDFYRGECGITRSAVAYADSPLGMFFYFLPKQLWIHIADETNLYREQNITAIATSRRDKLLTRQAKDLRVSVPTLAEIEEKLNKSKRIQAHEIVHVVALLFARAVAPVRDGLSKHWSTDEDGAIPRGTFSRFMKRDRFEAILKFLHFNNNEDDGAHADKAWKIRPILQAVETTFRRGYRLGKVISRMFNPMRIFMPDKPSKYGTKFYMTCCADTAYCSRVEIYCGADNKKKKTRKAPDDTLGLGPKAVVRNISKALINQPMKRLIVTDSFYSTVPLSLKLLEMDLYHVGTTRIDRLGWCPIHFTQKKRPTSMPRGTYRIAQVRDHPELVALSWMDSKPVNMLATGCSTKVTSVLRTEKDGTRSTVPCPQLVVDYGLGMGGVDVHDQLRLQRYSIQKCISLNMAVVNGYIVHCVTLKKRSEKPPTHAAYLRRLHVQLLALRTINFKTHLNAEDLVSVPIPRQQHTLVNTDEFYSSTKQHKRRQYLCKVCSAFADTKTKSFETSFYCQQCSDVFGGRVPLCRHVRRVESGNTLTCSQIWHDTWGDGKSIPPILKKKIRFRKRKREIEEEE